MVNMKLIIKINTFIWVANFWALVIFFAFKGFFTFPGVDVAAIEVDGADDASIVLDLTIFNFEIFSFFFLNINNFV